MSTICCGIQVVIRPEQHADVHRPQARCVSHAEKRSLALKAVRANCNVTSDLRSISNMGPGRSEAISLVSRTTFASGTLAKEPDLAISTDFLTTTFTNRLANDV